MGYISELRKLVGHRTLIMPCACLIIGDGHGRILLQKRVDDGTWGYHGGAMEIDESVEEALAREVMEELGVHVDDVTLLGIYSGKEYHHVYPNQDEVSAIDIVYYTTLLPESLVLQKEEVSETRWFTEKELPEEISPNHVSPIRDYLKMFHVEHFTS